jgi:hypothetical protein
MSGVKSASSWHPEGDSARRVVRAYRWQMAVALGSYALLLHVSKDAVHANPHAPWRFAVALLPLLAFCAGAWLIIRFVQRADELVRRVQLEALAFTCIATAILAEGYGQLEDAGAPHLVWSWIWLAIVAFYLVGCTVSYRRYQ